MILKKFLYVPAILLLMIHGCEEDSYSDSGSSSSYAGSGSFCAYNYPKDACDIVCDAYTNSACSFYAGSGSERCGSSSYDSKYDYGYSQLDGGSRVGACILSYNSSLNNQSSSPSTSAYTPSNADTSNGNSSNSDDSCWSVPNDCVSTSVSWSSYTENKLIVKYTNNCGARIYAKFCNGKNNGSEDCGASGIRAGMTKTWSTYDANGEYNIQYIGVTNPSKDWVCAGNTPGWYDN